MADGEAMSDWVSIGIDMQEQFNHVNVLKTLETFRNAVADNWRNPELLDQWSDACTKYPINPEDWAARPHYDKPQTAGFGWTGLGINVFDFSFSPLSGYVCGVVVGCDDATGSLSLLLTADAWIVNERRSTREEDRMEQEVRDLQKQIGDAVLKEYELHREEHPLITAWSERRDQIEDFDDRVWPQNQRALFHLVEELDAVLTIRRIEVDDKIWRHAPAESRAAFTARYPGRVESFPHPADEPVS